MSIHNNFPTISWIKLDGISVVKDEEVYIVKDFKTNLKYIFWSSDIPDQLTASNVMLSRTSSRFLIAINNKGECILVPNEEIVVSFDGNSVDAITEHIWGLYEKDEEYGDKFVSLEQNIEGITQTVGQTQEELGKVNEYVSKVDQKADSINLSVKKVQKEYTDDKEASELRENLNSAIIKINSNLGIFKSELTDYFKDNEMSNEEVEAVRVQLELLETSKINLDTYIDKVIYVAENNGHSEEAILLDSAKTSLDNIHTNLISTIENSIIDNIITSTEITVVIDAFARYSTKINEIKNTCDDIIILGMGGVITEELSRIDMLSDEIKLSVSKVETNFRDELESQGEDIQNIDKKYAEMVVNLEEGITSKIEHINTKIDGEGGIEHRLQSAEEKITPNSIVQVVKNSQTIKDIENEISYIDQRADSISLEVSKKVGQNSIISSINQTAEAIKINASKINLNGYVTVSDLGSSGTTTIHGNRIATGTIKVNHLSSNNENPIIKLFDNCSIDATLKNEQGQGNSIRLKADNENYIKVQPTGYTEDGTYIGAHTAIFSGFYPNHEVMIFQGNAHWGKIHTTQGILSMHSEGVYYGWNGNTSDNKLAYTSQLTWGNISGKPSFGTSYGQFAHGNHTHSNYASSSHNHYSEYIYPSRCMPYSSGSGYVGSGAEPWYHIEADRIWWQSAGGHSDKKRKENIRSVFENNNAKLLACNESEELNDVVTLEDMHEFINNDLELFEFNFKNSDKSKTLYNQLGFIANDMFNTNIGSKFIEFDEEIEEYVFNHSFYENIIAGALKCEIKKRQELENKVEELNKKLDSLTDMINKITSS